MTNDIRNPGHGLKVFAGMVVETNLGTTTILRVWWTDGRGSQRVQMVEISIEGRSRTYEITRRKLSSMMRRANSPRVRDEERVETPRVPVQQPSPLGGDTLAEQIAAAVQQHIRAPLDRDAIEQIINERITAATMPQRLECVTPHGVTVDVGIQHVLFPVVRRLVALNLNAWLCGPAGSGKSHMAGAIASSLGLDFAFQSVCQQTSKADLLGFLTPGTGEYVPSLLRKIYEHGGVFLLDEIDAGNPNVMIVLNAMLAGKSMAFPDRVVERHPDFRLIAGANTVGLGADRVFCGRNQIDGATLDRFAMIDLPYDPALIAAINGIPADCLSVLPAVKAIELVADEDAASVQHRCEQAAREIAAIQVTIASMGIRHTVGTRAYGNVLTMIRGGFRTADAMQIGVWKGLDADSVEKVRRHAGIQN